MGIRDVILPGDMKDLMNKVTEAKKAAEANLIARREETAAMRSQANTAKLLADNPTLMRLRELEVLEKVAATRQAQRRARRREGPGRPRGQPAVERNSFRSYAAPGSSHSSRGFFVRRAEGSVFTTFQKLSVKFSMRNAFSIPKETPTHNSLPPAAGRVSIQGSCYLVSKHGRAR